MNSKGFTLIELLVTIAIIGILATVAITAYVGTTIKAARSEAYSNLETLALLEEQRLSDMGDYTASLGECAKDHPDNVVKIQTGNGDPRQALRKFQPAKGSSFSYCIEKNMSINGPQPLCFRARAFGNSNTRVDGDVFMIDCNNARNFE